MNQPGQLRGPPGLLDDRFHETSVVERMI
jgi:hypothetical protein